LNCMYVNIRKGMLLSRTNFVMMSNIMLMFLLLLFLAGNVEKTNRTDLERLTKLKRTIYNGKTYRSIMYNIVFGIVSNKWFVKGEMF
jgi:hypothetical protein